MMIKDILLYMDKNYVTKNKLMGVDSMQTQQFRNHVILQSRIKHKLVSILTEMITSERNGNIIDKTLMKSVISMIIEV